MARILILDDDPNYVCLVQDILRKYAQTYFKSDYNLVLHSATDADEALSMVKENNYELLIVDILLAKMNGFEFVKEARKKFPQLKVPVVIVSAIDAVDLEYQSIRNGASAWYQKPLHPKSFAVNIFKLIQGN